MKPFSQLFLLAIFAVGVRCDGYVVHKCQDTARTTITTYEFVANETDVRLQNIDESKSVNLVIENEEDYDHYVVQNNPAVPRPTIDFSKKMLLAGRIIDPRCGYFLRTEISGDCREYTCTVVIHPMDCNGELLVRYFALIDRTDAQIKFDFKYEM